MSNVQRIGMSRFFGPYISGLGKGSKTLAGGSFIYLRGVFYSSQPGPAVHVEGKDISAGCASCVIEPFDYFPLRMVDKLQRSVPAHGLIQRVYEIGKIGKDAKVISFPTDPAKVRDFFRLVIREDIALQDAAKLTGATIKDLEVDGVPARLFIHQKFPSFPTPALVRNSQLNQASWGLGVSKSSGNVVWEY